MKSKKVKKEITENDLAKAIEEAFEAGLKLGKQGVKYASHTYTTDEIVLGTLAKSQSISDEMSKAIHEKHQQIVDAHMSEWKKDTAKTLAALAEIAEKDGQPLARKAKPDENL